MTMAEHPSSVARVNQIEAAHRQLEGAITLHFQNADPVVVHSIAANAANLFGALAMAVAPGEDWDTLAREAAGIADKDDYFGVMRGGAYFLKHARLGPDKRPDLSEQFEFRATESEGIIWWAIQNAAVVDRITDVESVFQLWFLARRVGELGKDFRNMDKALLAFPEVPTLPEQEQRAAGFQRLFEVSPS